jgi:CDP-alcohol phosphatidyltransferase
VAPGRFGVAPASMMSVKPEHAAAAGPAIGLVALALLIVALARAVALDGAGLDAAGWVAGVACGAVVNAALARGLSRDRADRLSPADWVTLARATLVAGVAALVADSFGRPAPVALLVSLAGVALALDAVDGWVARRTRAGALGARFDGEVDALLILVLSVYVARSAGAWVLAIGAARYAFLVAGWALPWLRASLPPRWWRKVVAATQGIVLAVAAAGVLPRPVTQAALAVALALLAESFGRDVLWLWRQRDAGPAAAAGPPSALTPAGPRRGRGRARAAAALTVLAGVLVALALVLPDQPRLLTPGAFVRLPLEGLVLVALAVALSARARRALAWVAGPGLALVVLLKLVDIGFWTGFDRPFDPYQDSGYAGIGVETLRDAVGRTEADLVVAGVVALAIALLVVMTLAVRRLTRVAADQRRWSLRAVAALGGVWALCWILGAQLVSHAPIASTSAAGLVVREARAVVADIRDPAVFAKQIRHDRFRDTPADRLLTGLRGKDVILAVVESYGRVAVQGSSFSPQVDAVLAKGDKQLQAAGFSARSGFLTSATFGGISWLAHSSLQSGLWVDTQRRYDQLVESDRFTLSQAFQRAGWRAIDDVPSNNRFWAPGKSFYHYDKVYDRRDVGYRGPTFGYPSMPDQYVMAALQRHELAKRHRRPVFAEVDLVSSHIPWTKIPHLIDWRDVGDGSIYDRLPVDESSKSALFGDPARLRAAYGRSIQYTMRTLTSFVQHYGDPNLVLVVYGDHQPWTEVSGQQPSRDVPISIIAHDPAVMKRIAGWGWNEGLRPAPHAPVWPMSAFRDRFLTAFGS